MNSDKICFIICVNNNTYLKECCVYLNRLYIPEGKSLELLTVPDASSMLAGYKEASSGTDALYKIFLHQDVFILNRWFLYDILSIFDSDSRIGIIGMAGTKRMPENFIMWSSDTIGCVYQQNNPSDYSEYRYDTKKDSYCDVECIDGFIMCVKGMPVFKEELFDGWDFYDVSICMEAKQAKTGIVIPGQRMPWCLHDDGGQLSMLNYDHYRQLAMQEYQANA